MGVSLKAQGQNSHGTGALGAPTVGVLGGHDSVL